MTAPSDPPLTPFDTEWWQDRLGAMHSLACDTDALQKATAEPWRKLSAYDVQRMAAVLADWEAQNA